MENNNTYSNQSQETSQVQPDQQQVYTQPVYQQQSYNYSQPKGTTSPGKEITGLIMGITALIAGVFGVMLCWIPAFGIIWAVACCITAIIFGIVTFTIYKKVHEQATVITNKIEIGKKLAKAGIIVGAASLAFSILIMIAFAGCAYGLSCATSNMDFDSLMNGLNY